MDNFGLEHMYFRLFLAAFELYNYEYFSENAFYSKYNNTVWFNVFVKGYCRRCWAEIVSFR